MRSAAQVAAAEAQIGVDHADQGEVGEVVALGDDLGADQHVDPALLHGLDDGGRGLGVARGVAGHHRDPRPGQELVHLLGQPLDPGTRGHQRPDAAAGWTVLRQWHAEAAVAALQPAA